MGTRRNYGAIAYAWSVLLIVIVMLLAWVVNIIKIVSMDPMVWDIESALRVVGIIVVPLGAIMGLFFS